MIEPHRGSRVFLDHLENHASADRLGFTEVVSAIGSDGSKRDEVMKHFEKQWPSWTPNEVSTNTAGYVARAREWGLVEAKQIDGQYKLTELGFNALTNGGKIS